MKERVIDLKMIAGDLRKRIVWIIVTTVLMALLCMLGADKLIKNSYKSAASFIVYDDTNDTDDSIYIDKDAVMRTLTESCIAVARSEGFVQDILNEVNMADTSVSDFIENNLQVEKKEGSLFIIEITMEDPEMSYNLAKCYSDKMIQYISTVSHDFSLDIVGEPIRNEENKEKGKMALILGAMLGFLSSSFCIILNSMVTSKIKSEADIKRLTDIPIIGTFYGKEKGEHGREIQEEIGFIKNSLEWNLKNSTNKGIMITGTEADVSGICYSLGEALSIAGKKILVVDMNQRNPVLTERTGLKGDEGFSDIILGKGSFESVIHAVSTESSSFDFIPVGTENIVDMDMVMYQNNLISHYDKYDYILVNADSVKRSAQTAMAAQLFHILISVTLEKSTFSDLEILLEHIDYVKENIMGIILN